MLRRLDLIESQTQKLHRSIQKYTEFSNIASGLRETLRPRSVKNKASPEKVFKQVAADARLLASTRNVTVSWHLREAPKLWISEDHLGLAAQNVVGNAIKYSFPGTEVLIEYKRYGTTLYIRVTSHGPEIPHNLRERIFELGFRTQEARRMDQGGTGLGLYMTREILRGYGAAVEVVDSIKEKYCEGMGYQFKNIIQLLFETQKPKKRY
jgi:signal transduction histidine kinase